MKNIIIHPIFFLLVFINFYVTNEILYTNSISESNYSIWFLILALIAIPILEEFFFRGMIGKNQNKVMFGLSAIILTLVFLIEGYHDILNITYILDLYGLLMPLLIGIYIISSKSKLKPVPEPYLYMLITSSFIFAHFDIWSSSQPLVRITNLGVMATVYYLAAKRYSIWYAISLHAFNNLLVVIFSPLIK